MDDITARLRDALRALCSERVKGTEDMLSAETSALEDTLEQLRLAFGEALEAFDDGLLEAKPGGWRCRCRRPRTLVTEFGEVTYARRSYIDDLGSRRCPLDELLAIPADKSLSPAAARMVVRYAADVPYRAAAALLCEHAHSTLSAPTVMSCLRDVGRLLGEADEQARHSMYDDGVLPKAPEEAPGLCMETDGCWVHLQGGHAHGCEVKALVAYAGKEPDGHGALRRSGPVVHFAEVAAPVRFDQEALARVAGTYDMSSVERAHLGFDGADWCSGLAEWVPAPVEGHLDRWHLARAMRDALPQSSRRSRAWRAIASGDLDGLCSWLEGIGGPNAAKCRALAAYVRGNASAILSDGPSLGTMEGTNAHLYASRMKHFGGGWSRRGASDMARIRSAIASGDELPAVTRDASFPPAERRSRERRRKLALERMRYYVEDTEGHGYEPPSASVEGLRSDVVFSADLDGMAF